MSKPDNDYLWDGSGEPDEDVARLEALLSPLAHKAPLDELRLRRKRSKVPWFVVGGVIAAAAIAIIVIKWPRGDKPSEAVACSAKESGFAFSARGGDVVCQGSKVPAGVLPVGGTLDTDKHEAELAIADIGSAQLSPNTRVRLDRTSAERHQLYLERGRLDAVVNAPPRIFAVGTPAGEVVDLGCAYVLEVDDTGAGSVVVRSGKVELEAANGRVIVVPAGASARLLAGRRASLPLAKSANAQLVAAVADFHSGQPDALDRILASAKPSDAITIANLVRLAPDAARQAVLDKLQELSPAPEQSSVLDMIELSDFDSLWFEDVVYKQMLAN